MADSSSFLDAMQTHGGMFAKSAIEVFQTNRETCEWLLDPLAQWTEKAYGKRAFEDAVHGYIRYCLDVAAAQREYERTGVFNPDSVVEITDQVYQEESVMTPYLWAVLLIYAFWPSMVNHLRLYREFVEQLPEDPMVLELGCGHGVLGLLAANHRRDTRVIGCDISPTAIDVAEKLKEAGGHSDRADFRVADVLDLDRYGELPQCAGAISAMLAEHLEKPQRLFASISRHLEPGGRAFVTTALESAQIDHVYDFHKESEPILMAENEGLRVKCLVCDEGIGVPGGRFMPRALALILEKPAR